MSALNLSPILPKNGHSIRYMHPQHGWTLAHWMLTSHLLSKFAKYSVNNLSTATGLAQNLVHQKAPKLAEQLALR